MRKFNAFLLTLVLIMFVASGCSLLSSSVFNPPSWIVGTWEDTATGSIEFEFTSDNMFVNGEDMKAAYEDALDEGDDVSITEDEVSDTKYEVTFTEDDVSVTYNFEKVDDETMNWVFSGYETEFTKVE